MAQATKIEKVEKFEIIKAELGEEPGAGKKGKSKSKSKAKAKTAKAKGGGRSRKDELDSDDSFNDFIDDDLDEKKKKGKSVPAKKR